MWTTIASLRLSAYAQWTPWDKTRIVVNASGGPVRYHRPRQSSRGPYGNPTIYLNIQQTIPWKIILRANAGFFGGYGSLYTRSKTTHPPYGTASACSATS